MNVLSLFDGISCGMIALDRIGLKPVNYYASEIDSLSIKISRSNYPEIQHIGNVLDVFGESLPKIDLLIGGSPCQGFSFAGKQLNFEDPRSKLFFEYVRVLKECRPRFFLLENNRMKKEYQDVISNALGVEPIAINSSLVSAQNRARLYWTNIKFEYPIDLRICLKDIVGDYEGIWVYPRGFNKGGIQHYKGKSPSITTSSWEHNFFIQRKNGVKESFTPEICEALQTIPIGYTRVASKSQRIKAIGNAWTVDVVAHILKGIKGEL